MRVGPFTLLCSFHGLMAGVKSLWKQTRPCSSLQVVEHLESDLGVRVQHVAIHKMKYSFQIWSAMMSSKDSEGQVCQSALAKAQLWRQQGRNSCSGPAVESCRLPKPTQGLSPLHVSPQISFDLFLKLHSTFSLAVLWVEALGGVRLFWHIDLFHAGW